MGFACLPIGREFVIWDLERESVDWLSPVLAAERGQFLYQSSAGGFCPLVREAIGKHVFSPRLGASEGGS